MRTFFSDILIQMKGIWARLEGQQRLVVSAVLLATVVGLGAMVWYAGQPSYETVFTAGSGEDLKNVQQALTTSQVSFVEDGFSIKVERSDRGRAQSAIAKAGLSGVQAPSLTGGSMLEDAATKQWRLDSVSRAQAQAAIAKLDGVVEATVSASRPRRLIAFRASADQEQARATILLRLRAGVPFEATARSAASIAASQLMVPMQNIDVVSSTGGHRWTYNPDRESGGGSSEFLNLQRNISDARTRVAQERLDQIWPGKTSVNVMVELDPKWEVRSEKVLPTEPLLKSEDTTKDSTAGAVASESTEGGTSKNEKKKREFITEIGERRTGSMMPAIRRISVAVLYDASLKADGFDENSLINTVKAIVGWDPARDQKESFSTLVGNFAERVEEVAVSSGPGMSEIAMQWAPMIGQLLGVLVVVMFLRGLFKRTSRPAETEAVVEPEIPEEDLAPEEQQKRMRREIERSIAADPAALAKMLEAWLMEQRA
jgi:flagellar biosynthesis/type III secretory pathway M-ring protein FliF/YscJ